MFWQAYCSIVMLAAVVQGITGFGYALVALSLLPGWMEIQAANLVVSTSSTLPMLINVAQVRREIVWREVFDCLAGAALGLPIGLYAFMNVPARWLAIATGAMILLISIMELLPQRATVRVAHWQRRWAWFAGCLSGILAGAVGIPGPPIVILAARQPWSNLRIRAFNIGFFVVVSVVKLLCVIAANLVDQRIVLLSLIALPIWMVGSSVGWRVAQRLSPERFRRLTFLLLALAGSRMIWS